MTIFFSQAQLCYLLTLLIQLHVSADYTHASLQVLLKYQYTIHTTYIFIIQIIHTKGQRNSKQDLLRNEIYIYIYIFFPMAQEPLVGQGLLIIEASPHSVGLLWSNDQPDAETSTT